MANTRRHRVVAGILIAVWPIAIPLGYLALLLSAREAIMQRRITRISRAIAFLHKEFKPQFFWWEPLFLAPRLAERSKPSLTIVYHIISWHSIGL